MQAEVQPLTTLDLEEVVRELAPRLLRFAIATIGDRALAEDASQEALVALVRRWRELGPPDAPDSFVFTIARRRARRWRWRQRLMIAVSDSGYDPAWDARVVETLAQRQRLDATLAAMRRLPARDREALALVAGGELDRETAAAVLEISRSALKMRIHRARKRLRELMEGDRDA